ncbi:hypothetical protein ACFFX1_55670 [Dactylosporangium sucinum]|uniref:Uncharacterized protein n=1 Tax=Dactylosporangium sucinum TaxID=1424081 RepID=A0A917U216_9ACTN|nr:hypothetical protein [Dactylosporangium sucinum]GGM52254.1 hypothetical protein GCM10007977_062300 [Dactylosporangium sucinum]
MIPPYLMNADDIRREIDIDTALYGEAYATAAERAVAPGTTITGLDGDPCTVTQVRGRRFVSVTSPAHPDERLIDVTVFKTTDGTPLQDLIDQAARPGEGR